MDLKTVLTAFLILQIITVKYSNCASLPANLNKKVEILRKLSIEAGLPQVDHPLGDVCLEEGCLEAAFELLNAINGSVNPCKDFYDYSCGKWLSSNPVPPKEQYWGRFNQIIRQVQNTTLQILQEPEEPTDAKPINQAKQYFQRCIDLQSMESLGLDLFKFLLISQGGWEILYPQGAWNSQEFDWLKGAANVFRLTYLPQYFFSQAPIFNILIMEDSKNSSRQIINLGQAGTFLPKDILLNPDVYPEFIGAYETFILEVAKELDSQKSDKEIQLVAKSIISFEQSLANISAPDEDARNLEKSYNLFTLQEYQQITDGFDNSEEFTVNWKTYLNEIFKSANYTVADNQPIVVGQLDYMEKAILLLKETPLETVNNYIFWRGLSYFVGDLTQKLRDIEFKFNRILSGAIEPQNREVTCTARANIFLGFATGKKFLDTGAFDEESKIEMIRMTDKLMISFKELIREANWMDIETKEKALSKADKMISFMGYPDWINNKTELEKEYAGLEEMTPWHLVNSVTLALYQTDQVLNRLNFPTDRNRFVFQPTEVNARHNLWINSITFAAGILQPPFFQKRRPKSINYGGIGLVIGHEITHAFDDIGSQFNGDGNLENWWDNVTKEEYVRRSQCLIDQYNEYSVEALGKIYFLNGKNTIGENIGDNGGLRESYRAYHKYLEENGAELRLPGLEALSTDQLFFLGHGNAWCESITDEGLVTQILTDSHSPARFRVNGPLHNSEEFAQAYNCPVDPEGMNRPSKCIVW